MGGVHHRGTSGLGGSQHVTGTPLFAPHVLWPEWQIAAVLSAVNVSYVDLMLVGW